MQRALVFVSRCQNLETVHNKFKFAALNPDGGFYYTIAAGGSSQAGLTEKWWIAQLWLDDVRRSQKYDLRRSWPRRHTYKSRLSMGTKKLHAYR